MKQEGGESFPVYLKRVQDLHEELKSSGQEMDEQLVANIAVKDLSPKYASIEEEYKLKLGRWLALIHSSLIGTN